MNYFPTNPLIALRSLKLWMVLRLYGLENLQGYIRNHIQLAKHFEGLVAQDLRFEVFRLILLLLVDNFFLKSLLHCNEAEHGQ